MRLSVPTAAAMHQLGRQLGLALLTSRHGPLVIALNGDLGTGKTTFAAGVLAGMGIEGSVRSPTYTLIEPYEAAGRSIYHIDLYRLSGAADLEALGVRDLLDPGSVLLVEWAERAGDVLAPDLSLQLLHADVEARELTAPRHLDVEARSTAGQSLIGPLVAKK